MILFVIFVYDQYDILIQETLTLKFYIGHEIRDDTIIFVAILHELISKFTKECFTVCECIK